MLDMRFCGDMILREKAMPVSEITPDILAALSDMADMMRDARGAGLAAPQVNISKRFIVMMDIKGKGDKGVLIKMINPEIIAKSDEMVIGDEGCLSVLGPDGNPVFADVARHKCVTVKWIDENGAEQAREFSGYSARIAQHEIDHLDGILFIDYLSSAKREMIMNKVKKAKKLSA